MLLEVKRGLRTPATSKFEPFVKKVNGWKPFTTPIKNFTLKFAGILEPPLKEALNTLRKPPTRGVYIAISKVSSFNIQFIDADLGLLHDPSAESR